MTNALERDDKDFSDYERNIVRCVREYGWFSTHVLADEGSLAFNYSTGFEATLSQPEIITFSMKHGHEFIGDIYDQMKAGKVFESVVRVPEILRNLDVVFLPVDKRFYSEYPYLRDGSTAMRILHSGKWFGRITVDFFRGRMASTPSLPSLNPI